MKYIDIHCHLDFPDYGEEIGEVLARMKEKEVGAITIGTDLESAKRAVKIAGDNKSIWACIGIHPEHSSSGDGGWLQVAEEFEKLVAHPKVVAIGECGLDYFRLEESKLEGEKERQTKLFENQIELALRHDKPLMLHCRSGLRDAYDDTLDILSRYKEEWGSGLRGNAHFFAGTVEQAQKFFTLGFNVSFTGVITFLPRRSLAEAGADPYNVIKMAPLDKIMSETDSPFVAPVPYRGKRNEPSFVIEVVKKIAELRGEDEEAVREQLLENATKMFGLPI